MTNSPAAISRLTSSTAGDTCLVVTRQPYGRS
jgi:hypothetical protein